MLDGGSGAGKTTVVDAVESALGARAANGRKLRIEPARPLLTKQIRAGEAEGGVILTTANGHSWERTISEPREGEILLVEGAGDGPNAPWARFGRSAADPWRESTDKLLDERMEALGAVGTPRHEAALAALATVWGSRRPADGTVDGAGDGEEHLAAVFVGLARRLEAAYPRSEAPLTEPAICLVDDIDKHLHPGTQQRVVPMLHRTFPGTQLIATVHSPLVLSTLHPRQITRLTRQGAAEPATAPYCLAIGPLGEGGRLRVGVAAGRALDRGVVADRPAVAYGPARLVACFGRPHGGQLDLAGLG